MWKFSQKLQTRNELFPETLCDWEANMILAISFDPILTIQIENVDYLCLDDSKDYGTD